MNQAPSTAIAQRLERLQGFLRDDPDNEPLRSDIFATALGLGQFALAQQQVDHLLARLPEDRNWRHRQAVLCMEQGDYVQAELLFDSLLAQGEPAPHLLYDLGRTLYRQGKFQEALDTLRPLVDGALNQVPAAMALWMRCQQPVGDLDELLALFVARSAEHELPPEAWGVASLVAFDLERVADARAWAARALQVAPAQREALVAMGTLALAAQDGPQACAYLEHCLSLYPRDGRARSALGMSYMLVGKLEQAAAELGLAVAAMPGHLGSWHGLAWSQVGVRDLAGAQASFEHALELDHNFGESHGGLAVALALRGERERARHHIERALRLDPGSLAALYARSLLDGEGQDPKAFRVMARRILGKRQALSGKSMVDEVLARMPAAD